LTDYGRKRLTYQRDLQLDEVAVGESLCALGEDHGRADGGLHEMRARGELEEVVVQAEETSQRNGLATEITEGTENIFCWSNGC
jgi:hypothetical protein